MQIEDFTIIDHAAKLSGEKIIAVEIDGQPYSSHQDFETYSPPDPESLRIRLMKDDGSLLSTIYTKEGTTLSDAMSAVNTAEEIQALGIKDAVGWIGYDPVCGNEITSDMQFFPDISTTISVYFMNATGNQVDSDLMDVLSGSGPGQLGEKNKVGFYHQEINDLQLGNALDKLWRYRKKYEYGDNPPNLVIFYYMGGTANGYSGGVYCLGMYEQRVANYYLMMEKGTTRNRINRAFFVHQAGMQPDSPQKGPRERYLFIFDTYGNESGKYTSQNTDGLGLVSGKYYQDLGYFSDTYPISSKEIKPYKIISCVDGSAKTGQPALSAAVEMFRIGKRYSEIPNLVPDNQYPDQVPQSDGIATRNGWGWKWQNRRVLA